MESRKERSRKNCCTFASNYYMNMTATDAVCLICSQTIRRKNYSTSNLIRHLRHRHSIEREATNPAHHELGCTRGLGHGSKVEDEDPLADLLNLTENNIDQKDESIPAEELASESALEREQVVGECDDVSIPLSPHQFLAEESDNSVADSGQASQRPESYKLRHNNHLSLVLESLAGDESFMDVTLTAQGQSIKAHKSVLSAVSPYFRGVLKENPCQHPIIIMPRDIKFEELNSIISYVYKGEMTVAAEDLASLLKTAEILQVTGLTPSEAMNNFSGQIQNLTKNTSQASSPSPSTATQSSSSKPKRGKHSPSKKAALDDSRQEEIQTRVDPADFLDNEQFLSTDMTVVKEEVESDDDDRVDYILPGGESKSKTETTSEAPTDQAEPFPPDERQEKKSSLNLDRDLTRVENTAALPFVCPHCTETHRPLDALTTHIRLKHPTKVSRICTCGRVFLKTTLFEDHERKCEGV